MLKTKLFCFFEAHKHLNTFNNKFNGGVPSSLGKQMVSWAVYHYKTYV